MAVSSSNVSAANSNGCSVVSESLSSNSVLQNGNLTWTVQALCSSPYNIMNTDQGIGYLCGGGVCVNVNGRSVTNSYTYGFAFTVPLNFPIGSATLKMTARASNYTTVQEINSNFSIMVGAMTVPTTTTTIATTTTVPLTYYCLLPAGTGYQLSWKNSADLNWGNPSLFTTPGSLVYVTSESTWRGMTGQTKYDLHQMQGKEIAIKPVPSGGCSSLNEDLSYIKIVTTTTTTIPPPVTTTTTVPVATVTTTTTVPPTTTTTLPRWRNYCQPYNAYTWYQVTLDSLYYTYPPSAVYPVPAGGCSSLNTVQTTTTTSPPTIQQKVQVAPIPVITSPVIQSPVITTPVIQSPVITLPKTISTEQENKNYESSCASQTWSVNGDCVIVSPWKYVWMNKTHTTQMRTGALCYSGKRSTATSSGACSHNGGVKNWIYYSTKSTSKVKYRCWLNKNTNTYNKNCIAV